MSRSERYPKEFYLLIFSSVTIFLASEMTLPILPLYVSEKGASLFELGVIIGLPSLCLILVRIPSGVVCDRVCGDYVLIAAALGQSFSQILLSVTPVTLWFYPIQVMSAVSIAPVVPLSIAITSEISPPGRKGETMGVFLSSFGLAITIGPLLCSYLLTMMSYSQVFLVSSIIPIVGVVPLLWIGRMHGFRKPQMQRPASTMAALVGIVHNRNLLVLTYLRLSYAVTYAFFATFFVVYCEAGLSIAPPLIVFMIGVRGMTDMLARLPGGKIIDRVDYRWAILVGFAVLAVVCFLIPEVKDPTILLALMAFYGFGVGLRVVSEWTILSNNSQPGSRSLTAAYLSTMHNIGSGFGSVLGGVLVVAFDIPFIFKIASLLMLSSILSIAAIRKQPREESNKIEAVSVC